MRSVLTHWNKQFDENIDDDQIVKSAKVVFRINYFVYIVDLALSWLSRNFVNFSTYEVVFGFLFNFRNLRALNDDDCRKNILRALEHFLKYDLYLGVRTVWGMVR